MNQRSAKAHAGGNGRGRSPGRVKPLVQVGDTFEDEYPEASALATECFANVVRTGDLLLELHNRQTRDEYKLSPGAREVLAIVEGAAEPLEPSVIADRLLITTGSLTGVLDTLERRGLIRRLPHPDDRRKILVDITRAARALIDELLPSLHAREHVVVSEALTMKEQRQLLGFMARLQVAARHASLSPPIRGSRRLRADRTPQT